MFYELSPQTLCSEHKKSECHVGERLRNGRLSSQQLNSLLSTSNTESEIFGFRGSGLIPLKGTIRVPLKEHIGFRV